MDKVSANGIYDIPMDDYHGDCCVGPSVSSSGLRTIEAKSPSHFYAFSYLNPKPAVKKETGAFNFGKAAHALLIEGVSLETKYHILPEGFRASATIKFAQDIAAKEIAEKAGKVSIKKDDAELITAMLKALQAHPYASAAFRIGESERSIIWQDKETGVWLKSRPDFLPEKISRIPDYKTATDARKGSFERDFYKYGYLQQAALMLDGLEVVTGKRPRGFFWVVQEKEPPYAIAVYVPRGYDLDWGKIQNRKAIHRFAECLKSGEWPGYPQEAQQVKLPAWAEIELSTAEAEGKYDVEPEDER